MTPAFHKPGPRAKRLPRPISRTRLKAASDKEVDVVVRKIVIVFNRAIRRRDCPGGWGRCISCSKRYSFENLECGRFIPSTRFSVINCNAQCKHCNKFKSGNLAEYRKNLVAKHGEEKVQMLEWSRNKGQKPKPHEAVLILEQVKEFAARCGLA